MSDAFAIHLPPERAFARNVLFAAEIVDAVTLEPVSQGLEVKALGLRNKPIVNCSGAFVWLEEGGALAQEVIVKAKARYEDVTVAAPVLPARMVRIELAPRYDYPFARGVTALRGTLVESFLDPAPVSGAEVWLQWIDDTAAGTTWIDAPTHSHSGAKGDFAALLRLTSNQVPKTVAGGDLGARLRVRHESATRTSPEFSLPVGRVADALPRFGWDELFL